jgi:divalent metal cation (Fe/Co/Zn/Cd) transporter
MKLKTLFVAACLFVVAFFAGNAAATPVIDVALPFDPAPIVTAVLALAVTVLIVVAGPKISMKFGRKAIRAIGNIF